MPPTEHTVVYNDLFALYMVIALVVGVLVIGWLLYSVIRFRVRRGTRPLDTLRSVEPAHERGHPIVFTAMAVGMAIILFALAFGTIGAVRFIEDLPDDPDALRVKVIGFQYGWIFEYPDGTRSIGDLKVPIDTTVILDVTSRDVFHNFAIPDYKIRIDAIPGKTNHLWFKATEVGEVPTYCAELCGIGHAGMRAKVTVMPKAEFAAWLSGASTAGTTTRPVQEIAITMTDDGTSLPELRAALGADIRVRVTNDGATARAFGLGAPLNRSTSPIPAGGTVWLNFTAETPGLVEYGPANTDGARGILRIAAPREVSASLSEYRVVLNATRLIAGEPVSFHVKNAGSAPHDLALGDWSAKAATKRIETKTPLLEPGETAAVILVPQTGGLDAWCDVPGHAQSGMKTVLEVVSE